MATTTERARLHPMVWLAALAVTAFSAVGIAAITGWLPTAGGHQALQNDPRMAAAEAAAGSSAAVGAEKPLAAARIGAQGRAVESSDAAGRPAQKPARSAEAQACRDCGTIEFVRALKVPTKPSGVGVVAGGVIGGVLGNQVGKGSGRDLATIGGAVLGGIAGNEVEKRSRTAIRYEVAVLMDSGERQLVHLDYMPQWHEGERVTYRHGALYPLGASGG